MFQEILRLIGTAAEDATCASIRPTMFTRPKASDGSPAPGWQGKSLKSGPWGHIWDPTEGRRRGIKAERYRPTVRLSCAGAAVHRTPAAAGGVFAPRMSSLTGIVGGRIVAR
jgi:hypothetical protein